MNNLSFESIKGLSNSLLMTDIDISRQQGFGKIHERDNFIFAKAIFDCGSVRFLPRRKAGTAPVGVTSSSLIMDDLQELMSDGIVKKCKRMLKGILERGICGVY